MTTGSTDLHTSPSTGPRPFPPHIMGTVVEKVDGQVEKEATAGLSAIGVKVASGADYLWRVLFSIDRNIRVLYRPSDPSSLAVTRILFGLLMFLDIPEERGLSEADIRWGDPQECRFPLFDFLQPLPLHWMCIAYLLMWIGSIGIALGAYFKLSCLLFILPYWYIFFLDKTAWNNHSYLYGILGILFLASDAHYYWSVDAWRGKTPSNMDIPQLNYIMFRSQLFFLYFHAGVKKTELDWLSGHSMTNLARHWVFNPFKPFLTIEEIDMYIVHGFAFLFDLTVGFLMYFDKTRPISFIFLIGFHLMNSQMFYIGMFPFVCLVTMPLFCRPWWPKEILSKFVKSNTISPTIINPECIYSDNACYKRQKRKKIFAVISFVLFVSIQTFLPYSHFITKGYNNWTNGLYGYSWDMMVHSWDTTLATVKVVNHQTNQTIYVDPQAWVRNNKWLRHGDMLKQYSKCIKKHLEEKDNLMDISIYFDVWISLNGRVHQRMFDPRVDVGTADWDPFTRVKWVMPLLENYTDLRSELTRIRKEVHGWSQAADVIFMADFPGFNFQNYINKDLTNVSLEMLDGSISLEVEGNEKKYLTGGDKVKLPSGKFHEIRTISLQSSAFLYTFYNTSRLEEVTPDPAAFNPSLFEDIQLKLDNILTSIGLVSNAFLRVLYSVPMIRRVRVLDDYNDEL